MCVCILSFIQVPVVIVMIVLPNLFSFNIHSISQCIQKVAQHLMLCVKIRIKNRLLIIVQGGNLLPPPPPLHPNHLGKCWLCFYTFIFSSFLMPCGKCGPLYPCACVYTQRLGTHIYTHRGWAHQQRVRTTFWTRKNSWSFSCAPDMPCGTQTWVMSGHAWNIQFSPMLYQ